MKAGDNLGKIAKKFGVTQKEILTANPKIKDANKIAVGQVDHHPGGRLADRDHRLRADEPVAGAELSRAVSRAGVARP